MSEVRALADRLLASRDSIHVLVNNAGALFNERQVTAEGVELTLATNLLSGFLLTNLLADRLQTSAPARVVNVSSGGMYLQGVSASDLQYERDTYNGSKAYARTKRGQVILTELWAEMFEGVAVNAMRALVGRGTPRHQGQEQGRDKERWKAKRRHEGPP